MAQGKVLAMNVKAEVQSFDTHIITKHDNTCIPTLRGKRQAGSRSSVASQFSCMVAHNHLFSQFQGT